VVRTLHFDRPHRQFIFTSGGGSGAAYAFSRPEGGPTVFGGTGQPFPDYVPVWVPPPEYVEPVVPAPPPFDTPVLPDVQPERELIEENGVAHDWGHLGRELIGGWLGGGGSRDFDYGGQVGGGAGDPTGAATGMAISAPNGAVVGGLGPESCEGMIWGGGTPPKGFKVVNFCGKGVLRKVRRRRRRRLLTASDKADISYIVATTGKGQLAASLIHRSAQ